MGKLKSDYTAVLPQIPEKFVILDTIIMFFTSYLSILWEWISLSHYRV